MDRRVVGWLLAVVAGLVGAGSGCTASAGQDPSSRPAAQATAARPVPRLVDLGSVGCVT
jgi:hypothetical protein